MRKLVLAASLLLAMSLHAQILTVGNSLGVSQQPYLQRDFPAIPASAWVGGLSFDSLTCGMVYSQLPQLLAWKKAKYPTMQVIINFTGEDDAAHSVPIPQFTGCVRDTIALEHATWPEAVIITPNVIPFAPYRPGWNVSLLAPMLVDGYNAALAGIANVDLWGVAAVPPYMTGNPRFWEYPESDPDSEAWEAFDAVIKPLVYQAYGVQ